MLMLIVGILTIGYFVKKYKDQRSNGVSFDDVDLFGTKKD